MGDPELEMMFTEDAAEANALAGIYEQAYKLQKYFTQLGKTMNENILAVYKDGHMSGKISMIR